MWFYVKIYSIFCEILHIKKSLKKCQKIDKKWSFLTPPLFYWKNTPIFDQKRGGKIAGKNDQKRGVKSSYDPPPIEMTPPSFVKINRSSRPRKRWFFHEIENIPSEYRIFSGLNRVQWSHSVPLNPFRYPYAGSLLFNGFINFNNSIRAIPPFFWDFYWKK